ncbi:MAG: metallophosphoesterase, partial [Hyphomicrobiaceae bacterium]
MRLAVIADVHGNLPALETILADIARRGADLTINLGDCVSGP